MSHISLERIFHGLFKNAIINYFLIYFDPSLASLKMGTLVPKALTELVHRDLDDEFYFSPFNLFLKPDLCKCLTICIVVE